MRRMKSNDRMVSPSGSGGAPSTNENSGTTPKRCIRAASSSVRSGDAAPPLFMAARVTSDDDSAPEKTIFSPERAMVSHVRSE